MVGIRIGYLTIESLFARGLYVASLVLDLCSKELCSDRPPSKSHVVSWLSARAWIASLNEGHSFASPEKWSRLSFPALARIHADSRRGSRTWERVPEPQKSNTAGLGRLPGRRCAWRRMSHHQIGHKVRCNVDVRLCAIVCECTERNRLHSIVSEALREEQGKISSVPTLFAKRRGSALRMRTRITGKGILDAMVGSALKSPARICSYRQLHHVVLPFRPDIERCASPVSQRKVACLQCFFTGVIFDPHGETASTDSTFAEPLFERGPRGRTRCNRDL